MIGILRRKDWGNPGGRFLGHDMLFSAASGWSGSGSGKARTFQTLLQSLDKFVSFVEREGASGKEC